MQLHTNKYEFPINQLRIIINFFFLIKATNLLMTEEKNKIGRTY